ncbi:MAG: hypothetical protein IKR02_03495 [Firmicutes bacterium]|nr:hypothetical protein [Bacillota bacterium]
MSDGFFRGKTGFTVVQNGIVRDRDVSMKAKGLYLIIQSYITVPDKRWRKSEFLKMVKEGEKAFETAWKELKDSGYLKVHMFPQKANWIIEYELLEEAQPGAHTFYYDGSGNLQKTNLDRAGRVASDSEEPPDQRTPQKGGNARIPQKGGNVHIPQNGGNVHTPHLGSYLEGSNAQGTYAEGSNANGGNINKDLSINTDSNNCDSIPSINHSESQSRADKRSMDSEIVVLDPKDRLKRGSISMIESELEMYNGIPYEWSDDVETMTEAILVLSAWNDYLDSHKGKDWNISVFKLAEEALIEMATAKELCEYNGAHVSYAKVIDQINIIYRNYNETTNDFNYFVEMIVDRFIEIQKDTRIMNQKAYMKSLIWTSFSTYISDWESDFHRSFHNRQIR